MSHHRRRASNQEAGKDGIFSVKSGLLPTAEEVLSYIHSRDIGVGSDIDQFMVPEGSPVGQVVRLEKGELLKLVDVAVGGARDIEPEKLKVEPAPVFRNEKYHSGEGV